MRHFKFHVELVFVFHFSFAKVLSVFLGEY